METKCFCPHEPNPSLGYINPTSSKIKLEKNKSKCSSFAKNEQEFHEHDVSTTSS
jgi:hypothetical protein